MCTYCDSGTEFIFTNTAITIAVDVYIFISKVTTLSSTATNSLGSLQDAEGSNKPSSGSLMDSGWMTVPLLHRQQ